jgi:UDPglucose 6-dehydrogenase
MKIAVVGTGYVGLVSGTCFSEFGFEVFCVDKNAEKIAMLNRGEVPIYEPGLDLLIQKNVGAGRLSFTTDLHASVQKSQVVFIAVGTPPKEDDGHADLTYVFEAAKEIARSIKDYTVVVTKSTVPVDTNRRVEELIRKENPKADFDVVSNPEFLREGSAIEDFMRPNRVVVGARTKRAEEVMQKLYRPLYLLETPMVFTTPECAELIKYASNSFLAIKISFINQIADLCEKCGADIGDVAKGVGLDQRIGNKFLHTGPGYGGSCFPKDTLALAQTAKQYGAPTSIVDAVVDYNEARKAHMADKIIEACGGSLEGKKIAILGLAFKPNTDDMRDAPSLTIIPILQKAGATIAAYDPESMTHAKTMLEGVEWCKDAYDTLEGAACTVILTEWNEFRSMDWDKFKQKVSNPVLVDMRNIYKLSEMRDTGIRYISLGRPVVH